MFVALFCRVIDNYGDAGVAWRLSRRLGEMGHRVELWIDDTATLARLAPKLEIAPTVRVRPWTEAIPDSHPDAAICLFGAALPEALLQRWVARPPVWINLEYLTCEDWALGCHGLPSPHPRLPLTQWFYFPGLRKGLGGVVHEEWHEKWGQTPFLATDDHTLRISLFAYANAALPSLLTAWNDGDIPISLRLCPGPAAEQAAAIALPPGRLSIKRLPWLTPDDYDRLLGQCDLNFVRGEDSFVRAQLAARPLVWQAYVQEDAAHRAKVDAFLNLYSDASAPMQALAAFNRAWNQQTPVTTEWAHLVPHLPALQAHARHWRAQVMQLGDLAENLMKFIGERL